jgi:hypothetical protein
MLMAMRYGKSYEELIAAIARWKDVIREMVSAPGGHRAFNIICLVKEPEILEITDRIAAAGPRLKPRGEHLEHLVPVLGPKGATLVALDDLAADLPIREHHLAVHRAHDARAGLLENADDPFGQRARFA